MENQPTRRQFLGMTAALLSGAVLNNNNLFGSPALIHSLGDKPNSLIKGVQIGVITYSFREMPDQSAEATLQYVLDSGASAVELMGNPAETFAGAPKSAVDMRAMYALMRKKTRKSDRDRRRAENTDRYGYADESLPAGNGQVAAVGVDEKI